MADSYDEIVNKVILAARTADMATLEALAPRLKPEDLEKAILKAKGLDIASNYATIRETLTLIAQRKLQEKLSSSADWLARVAIGVGVVGLVLAATQVAIAAGCFAPRPHGTGRAAPVETRPTVAPIATAHGSTPTTTPAPTSQPTPPKL